MAMKHFVGLSKQKKVSLKANSVTTVLTSCGLAIGAAVSMYAAPAGAVSLINSSVAFSGGTSNFFEQVAPAAGNTFSVNFNPGNLAFFAGRSGSITPFFPVAPQAYTLTPTTGNFSFMGINATNTFDYNLTNPLTFAFTNGANLTVGSGSVFRGAYNSITLGVDFAVLNSTGSFFSNGADNTPTSSLAFTFGDIPDGPTGIGGGYTVSAASVPEPLTIIGTIVGSTAVFGIRKKLLAAVNK
jgi:hypothetical protein